MHLLGEHSGAGAPAETSWFWTTAIRGNVAHMDDERIAIGMEAALEDQASQAVRMELCRSLAPAFDSTGRSLWVLGSIVGADRAEGRSPFDFGSDAAMGVAVLAQIAGQLISGAVGLLDADNLYSSMALVRQLVEVEYLAWAFAEDQAEAESWLRSTKDERLHRWQPRHLYKRSQGRFRGKDYGYHCELGGHPTPDAVQLLPEHSKRLSPSWWWFELAVHGVSAWDYTADAVTALGHGDWYERGAESAARATLTAAVDRWRTSDRMLTEQRSWLRAVRGEPTG
jgi:hypothetical protein